MNRRHEKTRKEANRGLEFSRPLPNAAVAGPKPGKMQRGQNRAARRKSLDGGRIMRTQNRTNERTEEAQNRMKAITRAVVGVCLLVEIWVIASWANVAATNYKPGLESAAWNFFKIIF